MKDFEKFWDLYRRACALYGVFPYVSSDDETECIRHCAHMFAEFMVDRYDYAAVLNGCVSAFKEIGANGFDAQWMGETIMNLVEGIDFESDYKQLYIDWWKGDEINARA